MQKNTASGIRPPSNQRGAALLIILVMVMAGALVLIVRVLNNGSAQIDRDKITIAALAQAKDALMGFATGIVLTPAGSTRPGDLPCPDLNDDGVAEAACDVQNQRLGRLPWQTLGLPDLRDSSGERLWYAVSTNFKNGTRIGTLNSDTAGTITVRDVSGAIIYNGTNSTGAIAVVLSAGPALIRQGAVLTQDHSGAVPCTPVVLTKPHCMPINYLDNITAGEDNQNFIDGTTDGFNQGPVKNAAGTTILNDRLIAITPTDLMPLLEKRVAGETLKCLTGYAAIPANQGRYPWAALLDISAAPAYIDVTNTRFGRVPNTPFNQTRTDSGNVMSLNWGATCTIGSVAGWWLNWKEMVFYAVANPYKPVSPMTAPACAGACLIVNPPVASATKQVAVFMAGRRLAGVAAGQPRVSNNNKGTIANYLESQNATPGDDAFERNAATLLFNDVTVFAP